MGAKQKIFYGRSTDIFRNRTIKMFEEFTFFKYGVDRTQRKVLVFILFVKHGFIKGCSLENILIFFVFKIYSGRNFCVDGLI